MSASGDSATTAPNEPTAAVRSALAVELKQQALALGFAGCGIAEALPLEGHGNFADWLRRGFQAGMAWMGRPDAIAKRTDLRLVMPGARSVVCVAMHYRTDCEWDPERSGEVARYARGDDYHDIMTARLRELLRWIQDRVPCSGRVYVDTGPLLERELGQRAGLGWIGKNTMLLSRELGSYFLLGEILLDLSLPPDQPHLEQFCGSCTKCLDACPTSAFEAPGVLNANKCISYHTIENREHFPIELREKFGDWFFGCDICQEVCPWNNKSSFRSQEPELWTRPHYADLRTVLTMSDDDFSSSWSGSPLKRPKRRGLKRNALNVLRNRSLHRRDAESQRIESKRKGDVGRAPS